MTKTLTLARNIALAMLFDAVMAGLAIALFIKVHS